MHGSIYTVYDCNGAVAGKFRSYLAAYKAVTTDGKKCCEKVWKEFYAAREKNSELKKVYIVIRTHTDNTVMEPVMSFDVK